MTRSVVDTDPGVDDRKNLVELTPYLTMVSMWMRGG